MLPLIIRKSSQSWYITGRWCAQITVERTGRNARILSLGWGVLVGCSIDLAVGIIRIREWIGSPHRGSFSIRNHSSDKQSRYKEDKTGQIGLYVQADK
ncbi:hypothetical protein ASPBRDRAFT_48060 [Aspergillus brasiliensis CBS 101740]|uniref:Uncharacterized protein n=1 Tax=Aspergillus brasiliensis (strain CBS 101740 / IMI 381727 / IBT 21946) TaxID=767769 RepID=A0A1L9U778_ASPBC|nr:hypothetical protein ASPBRDRAFT_48060 [Aspergillus brasiliensis CBS 101740]